jgi:WD40 repeat protein/tRNA A-37 threonylcarbamoyl transferase component Bud32
MTERDEDDEDAEQAAPSSEQPSTGASEILRSITARVDKTARVRLDTSGDGGKLEERAGGPDGSRYSVIEEIARGGVGIVYRGMDHDLGRDVAMKVLRKRFAAKPEILERFVEEAQIGGQLQHPGILPVYELGLQESDRPYIAMKLVKGKTLTALLEEWDRVGDRRRLLGIFERVCDAMAYAHMRRVIHRDLKPSNLMIGAFGEVLVVDWGLAKVLPEDHEQSVSRVVQQPTDVSIISTVRTGGASHHSMTGSVLGTPAYMPPEQAIGFVEKLTPRSDVFALGAILLEILTGKPPYTEDGGMDLLVQAAQCRTSKAFERLHACAVDDQLIAMVKECLDPDPANRPKNADVLARRFTDYLAAAEERAREADNAAAAAVAKATSERRARKVYAVGLLAIGAALAAVSLGFFRANAAEARAESERQNAAARAEELRRRVYEFQLNEVAQTLRNGTRGELKSLLDSTDEDLRGWEWDHLRYRADQSVATLAAHDGPVNAVEYRRDGQRFLTASGDGLIKVFETSNSTPTVILGPPDGELPLSQGAAPSATRRGCQAAAFDPEGRRIAAGYADGRVLLWDLETGIATELGRHQGSVRSIAWSPRTPFLASGGNDGVARVWSLADGSEILALGDQTIFSLDFHLSGEVLLAALGDNTIAGWSVPSGSLRFRALANAPLVWQAKFSADGQFIASVGGDNSVRVFDSQGNLLGTRLRRLELCRVLDLGSPGMLESVHSVTGGDDGLLHLAWNWGHVDYLRGHESPIRSVAFAPVADRIVSGAEDGTVKLWTPEVAIRSWSDDNHLLHARFSPDGQSVLAGGPWGLTSLDLASMMTTRIVRDSIEYFDLSPDGARIAAGVQRRKLVGRDQTLAIFDRDGSRRIDGLQGHGLLIRAVRFDPSGERVASSGTNGLIRVRSAATGTIVAEIETTHEHIESLCWSEDGARILAGCPDGNIEIWEIENGRKAGALVGHEAKVTSLEPSRFGLVSTGADGTVRLWDPKTNQLVRTFAGHEGSVEHAVLHPDGTRILSAGLDQTVRVWDTESGRLLLILHRHQQLPNFVAFSPDGSTAISGGNDHQVIVHETRAPLQKGTPRTLGAWARSFAREQSSVPLLKSEIVAKINSSEVLDDLARKQCLAWVDFQGVNIAGLSAKSLRVSCVAGLSEQSYERALAEAEAAAENPNSFWFLDALIAKAAALHRSDRHAEALTILQEAERDKNQVSRDPLLAAFFTLVHHALGQKEAASAHFHAFEQFMQDPSNSADANLQALLAEIRAHLHGPRELTPLSIDLEAQFNKDIVFESSSRGQDFLDAAGSRLVPGSADVPGLPTDGSMGVHQLGDYSKSNCIQLTDKLRHLRFNLPPGNFAELRFLVLGGGGDSSAQIAIYYQEGEQRSHLSCPDWRAKDQPGVILSGLAAWQLGSIDLSAGGNLYEYAIQLDQPQPIALEITLAQLAQPTSRLNLLAITAMSDSP